jgi:pilus assembly protein CpaF
MVAMANLNLPERAVRQQIANGIQVVLQVSRMPYGNRKLISISEVVGMEGDVITMQELFLFERQGMGEDGAVLGRFRPTGIRPRFADFLQSRGVELAGSLFLERPTDSQSGSMAAGGDRGRW